ncbi:MAG: azurin [Aliifodinibius sp.]|nr:azurin [Fodinibius sp.]NIV14760.1 azurin [Fodinibius sp.]NIX02034.1 azurin [Phycisphaerae bacterium]NIY25227.1 azurin [Fodinibius sp.]
MTWLNRKVIGAIFTTLFIISLALPLEAQEKKTIEMKGTDDLQFSVEEIIAKPGQEITIKLTTVSNLPKQAMAHNVVVLAAEADASAVANASARASENEYIAPDMTDQMIAYTGMAGGGETVEVTFKAPQKPGEYEYICTFPGHYAGGMTGKLIVN